MSANDQFPNTRWSVILEGQGSDSEVRNWALEQICRTYWLPIYVYGRSHKLWPTDAEDLTQRVLSKLLDKNAFQAVAVEKGKLRSCLRVAPKNYLRNDWKKAGRVKRGGGGPVRYLFMGLRVGIPCAGP